ncbi:MAG: UDP-N-acetylmuramoyl-tripeptide--D-alanyl-D-alanine ligase [Flavobacteriaceae bacterium]|nr:UDP-N-acetylmuramoyl-tripeptide--D-alanyl-D-alanine ligase [Flavobacteriaceae bacterium]
MTIESLYSIFKQYPHISTDTRSIKKNSLFFALKGERFNGNKFAESALKKGAVFAIIDEKEYHNTDNTILVTNVLETLQALATYHRKQLNIPVISLTGSNGKTTTKELINAVLSKKYNTTATVGNLNNHIGVPLTLLSMTHNTEIGIIEMGANHLKEIEFLCSLSLPNFGYITNFGKAHLEGFGSAEGIIMGKSELYDFLKNTDGLAFYNDQDTLQKERTKNLNHKPFPSSLKYVSSNPYVVIAYENTEIKSQLIGNYNYSNIAAAITIGKHFEISKSDIKTAIENYIPSNNRSQIILKGTNQIILDAYNANPSSMEVALNNLNELKETHKIAVLGDMFELGNSSEIEHQHIASKMDEFKNIKTYLIGSHFSKVNTKKASKFESFSEFIKTINFNDFKNSTILIKGSRGMALERLLNFL